MEAYSNFQGLFKRLSHGDKEPVDPTWFRFGRDRFQHSAQSYGHAT